MCAIEEQKIHDLGEFLFAVDQCCLPEVLLLFLVRPAWLTRTILLHCKGFNEGHVANKYKEITVKSAACFFMHSALFLWIRYLYN